MFRNGSALSSPQNSSCRTKASPKSVAWLPTNRSYFSTISSLVSFPSCGESRAGSSGHRGGGKTPKGDARGASGHPKKPPSPRREEVPSPPCSGRTRRRGAVPPPRRGRSPRAGSSPWSPPCPFCRRGSCPGTPRTAPSPSSPTRARRCRRRGCTCHLRGRGVTLRAPDFTASHPKNPPGGRRLPLR